MNKKQYNNVIDWTLKHDKAAQAEDSLATARAVFNNMGVALPNGSMQEVYDTIKTNKYMGWRACTMEEAQQAANKGTATIGISKDRMVILSAIDEEEPVAEAASVMTISENTSAYAVDGLEYYSYGYGSTIYVGKLTVFAANEGGSSFLNTSGHAFLSFKNTSSCPITVGGLSVLTDEEITFGTWGNQGAHIGIWYNLESYFINTKSEYGNRVSLSVDITQGDVDLINTVIAENDAWGAFNNCSSFAIKVWNVVSSKTLSAGTPNTPTSLMSSIEAKTGYEVKRDVLPNDNIGYVRNGAFVSVSVATSAFSTDAASTLNGHIRFVVPINFNPNSNDMEVW